MISKPGSGVKITWTCFVPTGTVKDVPSMAFVTVPRPDVYAADRCG